MDHSHKGLESSLLPLWIIGTCINLDLVHLREVLAIPRDELPAHLPRDALSTMIGSHVHHMGHKHHARRANQPSRQVPEQETSQQLAIGEVLALLAGATAGRQLTGGNPAEATTASRTAEACEPRSLEPETRPGRTSEVRHVPAAGAATGSVVSRRGRGTLDSVRIRSDPAGSGAPGHGARPGGRSSGFSRGGAGCA